MKLVGTYMFAVNLASFPKGELPFITSKMSIKMTRWLYLSFNTERVMAIRNRAHFVIRRYNQKYKMRYNL